MDFTNRTDPKPPDHTHRPRLSDENRIRLLESALDTAERESVGTCIGPYKLLQKIGEGGFGDVWMAEQSTPLQRRVALKIVKAGMDTDEVIARFEAERQALALLDHANIARIFDAGTTQTGRPYFIMELVRGVPITTYCDENRLTAEERLRLFLPLCQAVQHAHQKGIIHRDIKPSNILVTLHDGVPVPKIIDFGIAKALEQRLTERTLVTRFHAFVGTPVYTSPEQMEMSGLDVDTRSDIYSLGVLLYELLTGRPPFDPEALLRSGLEAMRRTLREADPPRPSHRIVTLTEEDRCTVAQRRGTDAVRLSVFLRGDVDWIVMRCLEKDRTRRYDTAAALAQDICRHLQNEPVEARPPSQTYRLAKFYRRHRVGVLSTAAIGLSLVGGVVVSSTLFLRERAARTRAVAAERAEAGLRRQAETAGRLEAQRASRTSQALAERFFHEGRTSEALAHLVRAAKADPDNGSVGIRLMTALAYRSFAMALGDGVSDAAWAGYVKDGRHFWTLQENGDILLRPTMREGRRTLRTLPAGVEAGAGSRDSLAQSADGKRLAVSRAGGKVSLFDLSNATLLHERIVHGADVVAMALTHDGGRIATSGADGTVRLWSAAEGRLLAELRHPRPARYVVFSGNGRKLFTTTGSRGQWRLWSGADGAPLSPPLSARTNASSGAFNRDGSLIAITDNYGTLLFEAEAEYRLLATLPHDGPCYFAAFSHDGARLVTTSDDATAKIWAVPSGKPIGTPLLHGGRVAAAHYTGDDRYLVTLSGDGKVRAWDMSTGALAQEPVGTGEVKHLDVHPEDAEFITLGRDRVARRWSIAPGAVRSLCIPDEPGWLWVQPDRQNTRFSWVLSRSHLSRMDLLSGRRIGGARQLPVPIASGVLSDCASYACVNTGRSGWELWDLRPEQMRRQEIAVRLQTDSTHFSASSAYMAALDRQFNLHVWEVATGRLILGPIAQVNRHTTIAFSPSGDRIALGIQQSVEVRDLRTGVLVGAPLRADSLIRTLQYSPDGKCLALGVQAAVQLWNVETQRPVCAPLEHRGYVRTLAFSRDGRRLLSCDPMEVRLWELPAGKLLHPPIVGGNDIAGAYFTEDEENIATWARTQSEIRIWSAVDASLLSDPMRMDARLYEGTFFLTRQAVVAGTVGGPTYVWPLPPTAERRPAPQWLLRLATAVAGGEIDGNAVFRSTATDPGVYETLREEISSLPREAPFAAWGKWFLADRDIRPIAPGFQVNAAEAARIAPRPPVARPDSAGAGSAESGKLQPEPQR